ncbi:MAG TPA: UDP-N-acetylglucosamine 1-carboxyvinyltransferase [Thermotogota bacterium]|nr:UDP-N-acetylglucosamine 1-carboxyvinyltransferase [Thermotogota bacterium]HPH09421.1 UDP-N-acetylglucosamine 1-carboxyvinyltransferase [Thermotogota bacterium]HPM19890.1 UDP-N-acetylglucosamine 1-carboxyvinyltransferase [Thermotogota bacterium]
MKSFQLKGGIALKGQVRISGSKNTALPLIAASLLTEEPVILKNVPNLEDVRTMVDILKHVGVAVSFRDGTMAITPKSGLGNHLPYESVRKMRASFNVLGPLVMRHGEAHVPLPGGCAIGPRPVDMHLEGMRALGIETTINHGVVSAKRIQTPDAQTFHLRIPSVGTTEQLLSIAVLMEGAEVVLNNVALEPEVQEMALFLNRMGARIEGIGTSALRITGVKRLFGTEYEIIPDRIETGTYLLAALVSRGDVELVGYHPGHNVTLVRKLQEMGADIRESENRIRARYLRPLRGTDIHAEVYPGVPTDLQPQLTVLAAVSEGVSVITDTVFTDRFVHVDELKRLGANCSVRNHTIIVHGVDQLKGAPVKANDLRGAAALILAGINAKDQTVIQNIDYIFRGYEEISSKLRGIGAQCELVEEELAS